MRKLTPRQSLFVHEYLVDLNATQAAIRAGYSKKTAEVIGYQLLKKTLVSKAIEKEQKKRKAKLEITADMWLRELWLIGKADLRDYFTIEEGGAIIPKPFDQMPEGVSRALESIEETRRFEDKDGQDTPVCIDKIRFKLHSKTAALDLIGKHLGFLKDQAPTMPQNVTVIIERRKPQEKPNA